MAANFPPDLLAGFPVDSRSPGNKRERLFPARRHQQAQTSGGLVKDSQPLCRIGPNSLDRLLEAFEQ